MDRPARRRPQPGPGPVLALHERLRLADSGRRLPRGPLRVRPVAATRTDVVGARPGRASELLDVLELPPAAGGDPGQPARPVQRAAAAHLFRGGLLARPAHDPDRPGDVAGRREPRPVVSEALLRPPTGAELALPGRGRLPCVPRDPYPDGRRPRHGPRDDEDDPGRGPGGPRRARPGVRPGDRRGRRARQRRGHGRLAPGQEVGPRAIVVPHRRPAQAPVPPPRPGGELPRVGDHRHVPDERLPAPGPVPEGPRRRVHPPQGG